MNKIYLEIKESIENNTQESQNLAYWKEINEKAALEKSVNDISCWAEMDKVTCSDGYTFKVS